MNAYRHKIVFSAVTTAAFALLPLLDPPAVQCQPQGEPPAALLIYPRVEASSAAGTDTEVYIANTSNLAARAYCVYTAGITHCSENGQLCATTCTQRDFLIALTPRQIVSWSATSGLTFPPIPPSEPLPTAFIPGLQSDPFIGQLRCLQVDDENQPVARNDLVGNATVLGPQFSTATYEAIGVRSTGANDGNMTLCLGADATGKCNTAEYAECPDSLSVNHFFDGADLDGSTVDNHLTLVPCSLFYVPRPGKPSPDDVSINVNLTVVNEFGVQTSLPLTVTCFADLDLSTIPAFSVATQGTLGGQTLVHSSQSDSGAGPGLVGVLEQTFNTESALSSSVHGLSSLGVAGRADEIGLPSF